MALANIRIIGGEHVLRLPPRPVALDDTGDGDVADRELLHSLPSIRSPRLQAKAESVCPANKQTFDVGSMSALPPKADISSAAHNTEIPPSALPSNLENRYHPAWFGNSDHEVHPDSHI